MQVPQSNVVMDLHFEDFKFKDNVAANNWTFSKAVRFIDGRFGGQAINFDFYGAGAFVENEILLPEDEDWTISFWNKRLRPPVASYEALFNTTKLTAPVCYWWIFMKDDYIGNSVASIRACNYQAVPAAYCNDYRFNSSLNEWIHYAFVHTKADNYMRAFRNGLLTDTGTMKDPTLKWGFKIKFLRTPNEQFRMEGEGTKSTIGAVDDLVALKGTALWTEDFRGRVPQGPLLKTLNTTRHMVIKDDKLYGIKK